MKSLVARRRPLLIVVSVGMGLAALWLLARPSPSLLERAHAVATIWNYVVPQPYRWLNDEEVLFQARDGKVMLCKRSTGETRPDGRTLGSQRIEEPRLLFVRAPHGWTSTRESDVAQSPRGDRMAYAIQGVPPPLYPEIVYRTLPSLKRPERTEALCVSGLDGSDAREVGRLTPDDAFAMSDGPRFTLTNIRWLPGGRAVSFLHGDTLYVVEP